MPQAALCGLVGNYLLSSNAPAYVAAHAWLRPRAHRKHLVAMAPRDHAAQHLLAFGVRERLVMLGKHGNVAVGSEGSNASAVAAPRDVPEALRALRRYGHRLKVAVDSRVTCCI